MEQCLISRLGNLQCLPSYLYTCVGNQIRQSQKEPFCTASGPFLVSAHHGLSICLHPYDVVRPASGPMQMWGSMSHRCDRKYEYVIHLATIASSWNDIDIKSKPKSKFPYYSTVCSKNHKTHISLNSSPIFNVKIALELC